MEKTSDYLVLGGYDYLDSLPFYEGDLNGTKFPILMSDERVKGSQLWVCVKAGRISQEDSAAVAAGKMGRALPHMHTCDSAYLLIGEPGSVTAEVELGDKHYTVTCPSSVYIPAGMSHAIRVTEAKASMWGGIVKVCYNGKYNAMEVPEDMGVCGDTDSYINHGYHWSSELAGHKGKFEGKGYPILLSVHFLKEAKTWICPALMSRSEEECEQLRTGNCARATPHFHDNGDEMYMILGEEDSVTIRITLDGEEHIVRPPAAVYIPAYVSHTLDGIDGTAGLYGGPCAIFSGPLYMPIPTE